MAMYRIPYTVHTRILTFSKYELSIIRIAFKASFLYWQLHCTKSTNEIRLHSLILKGIYEV